ncbi:MAG: hypothetical protein M9921_01720 [Fimbriimonadaceae bacterium]|nr:hypothetical protein [Chthonomonadaceae bacterium]MCO5295554.1 hypothetical protein [Fimbriimonadaceae bacterium]
MSLPMEWMKGMDPTAVLAVVLVIAVVALYLVWTLSRKIVRWGFFAFYAACGFGVLWLLQPLYPRTPVPYLVPAVGGVLFAMIVSMVRSKVMRVVGAIVVLGVAHVLASMWTGLDVGALIGGAMPEVNAGQSAALFDTVKERKFPSIARKLAKRDGEPLPAGWLSEKPYAGFGLDADVRAIREKWSHPGWRVLLAQAVPQSATEVDLWTPGGSVTHATKGLVLKERPTTNDQR